MLLERTLSKLEARRNVEDTGNTRQSVSREFPLESYKMNYEVVMLMLIIHKMYNCLDYISICLD